MVKTVLEDQPHLPKTLLYEDIDKAVFNWVDNSFDLVYEGKRLPTYKLFSNQRISEYGQTWQNKDEDGNLLLNFKTLTRENNPQKGDSQGGFYNIPGDRTWPLFRVPSIDENGVEFIEEYSMRQPTPVNFIYTLGIFTNSYQMLNEMNSIVQREFNSLQRYIFPNGFAIPMTLVSTSDESEYTIDDRKYYNQTYQVKVAGYIVTENDYVVKKIPSRTKMRFITGSNAISRKSKEKFDIQGIINLSTTPEVIETGTSCDNDVVIESLPRTPELNELSNPIGNGPEIDMEEICGRQVCFEDSDEPLYVNRKVIINISIDYCESSCEFEVDTRLSIETIELDNIKDYRFYINDELFNIEESDVNMEIGDIIRIETDLKNPKKVGKMTICCYDVDSAIKNDDFKDEETEEASI